jgi:hypothetical protein
VKRRHFSVPLRSLGADAAATSCSLRLATDNMKFAWKRVGPAHMQNIGEFMKLKLGHEAAEIPS